MFSIQAMCGSERWASVMGMAVDGPSAGGGSPVALDLSDIADTICD
jgi:hypothetical protein